VYNAMAYDNDLKKNKGPVIYLDIGTQATDVIIAEAGRVWIRTFPLGGTHFTEAIASAFKLSYSKAEKLKLEASSSKYAKQIMQAMRPVFSDLLQDLQRSIGYYQSLHRENELSTMVGLGSTFKIPGLRKFLGQQLQINVLRLDEYKQISVSGREAASFSESAVNLATAYGAALQGVGLSDISANVVPVKILREQMWHAKTKWFAAAAAIAIVGSAATFIRPLSDQASLNPGQAPDVVRTVLQRGNSLKQEYQTLQSNSDVGYVARNMQQLMEQREIWPYILQDASAALASSNPHPDLFSGDLDRIRAVAENERRLIELQRLGGQYAYQNGSRRIAITMDVQFTSNRPIDFLNDTVAQWLRDNAERDGIPYRILADTISVNPNRIQRFTAGESDAPTSTEGGGPRPPQPTADSPPSMGGPGTGGRGGAGRGGAGTGTAGGRGAPTAPPPPQQAADGPAGAGGLGGGTVGWIDDERPPQPQMPPPFDPTTPGGAGGDRSHSNLDELAPIPSQPSIFPRGMVYYRVPVTFTIELLGETGGQGAQQQQQAPSGSGGYEEDFGL